MNKIVTTVLIYVFGFFAACVISAVDAAGLTWEE